MTRIRAIAGIFRRTLLGRLTWVRTAILLLALFGVLHLLGWRDDTAIISGTTSPTGARWMVIRGVLYALSYFAAVIVSPILILAAGFTEVAAARGRSSGISP